MTNPYTWAPTPHETYIARRILLWALVVAIPALPIVTCIAGLSAGLAVFVVLLALAFIAWCLSLPEGADQ